jgi:hypothetical protein
VVYALPLSLTLFVAQVLVIVDRQPFTWTDTHQFTIRVANDLTNRQRYWLAYADDGAARDRRRAADAAPTVQRQAALRFEAFQYAQQAALLTKQFALGDRAEWSDLRDALGGREEFVTPVVEEMEANARTFESAGDADRAARVRAGVWSELAFLLRIDPTRRSEFERRFSVEEPGRSFDLFLAERFVVGRPMLPEATLRAVVTGDPDVEMHALRGAWRLLEVWNTGCASCRDSLVAADSLAREFPDRVIAAAVHEDPEHVRLHLASSGVTVPAVVISDEAGRQLGVSALPAHVIVSPDGRFAVLADANWAEQMRRILAAAEK